MLNLHNSKRNLFLFLDFLSQRLTTVNENFVIDTMNTDKVITLVFIIVGVGGIWKLDFTTNSRLL